MVYTEKILDPNLEYQLAQRLSSFVTARPDTLTYLNELIQALLGPSSDKPVESSEVDSLLQNIANSGYTGQIYLAVKESDYQGGNLVVNLYDIPQPNN